MGVQPDSVDRGPASAGDSTHTWITHSPLLGKKEFCKVCGFVRRADRQNEPCRGSVALRAAERPLPSYEDQAAMQPTPAAPAPSTTDTRPHKPGFVFNMRISASERRSLEAGAAAEGLSMANYIRARLGWPKAERGNPYDRPRTRKTAAVPATVEK